MVTTLGLFIFCLGKIALELNRSGLPMIGLEEVDTNSMRLPGGLGMVYEAWTLVHY